MSKHEPPTCADLIKLYRGIFPESARGQDRIPRDENRTRMGRALSWLERCEATNSDEMDERFLFLWIAFNAAYGDDAHMRSADNHGNTDGEHLKIVKFLREIADLDKTYRLADIIRKHHDEFCEIIDNRFLYHLFWRTEYHSGNRNAWKRKFHRQRKEVREILKDKHLETEQMKTVLCLAFDRLYMLRNQILHGSASWRDHYNRSSLESGDAILRLFIPEALKIMLDAMEKEPNMRDWGQNPYPPYLETPDDITKGPPPRPSAKGK